MATKSVPAWMWDEPRMVVTLAEVIRVNNEEAERRARQRR